jgi:ADP-ribose pyrophosphatase YjhB (NUDIX family)
MCATPLEIKEVLGELRPVCPNCGFVQYDDPKVAAGVLLIVDRRVLLVRRVMDPYAGQWSIPAGFVNAFEDPLLAAARECREETGLEATGLAFFDLFTGREHPRGSDILLVYTAKAAGGTLRAADDADQAAWFSLDALPTLAFHSTQALLNKVKAAADK